MKALPFNRIFFLILLPCFIGCTDPDFEIAESAYFTKTLPAEYRTGADLHVIHQRAGGYLAGNSVNLIQTNAFGNNMELVNYPSRLLKAQTGWYGITINQEAASVTLDQLDADLRPVGSFSFETGLEAPLQIRYLDESPDKQFLLVSAWADGENWILLLDQNVVVWKFQLPQELNGAQFRSNFGTAFYFSANEIQMVTIAQEGGKQGLYLIELSQQSGMPGTIRPLVTDLTNFHRIRRIGDRFLVEGYFEESGEYRPYNDLYPALALLDQDFNQYRYWHLDIHQYRNIVVSNNSDHLYLFNSEGNSYYQTVEQLDFDGATLDKWRIRDEAAIFHVEMEENGDFLILGQMDRTNEYGQNDAAYFIRSKAKDPFVAFY